MKTCASCKTEKPRKEFHKAKIRKDGLKPYCKTCRSDKAADRNKRNPEKAKEQKAAWRKRNPNYKQKPLTKEQKARRHENHKRWRAIPENREKERQNSRDSYEKNKEQRRKKAREYAANKRATSASSVVYCISDGAFVKIGYTHSTPESKLASAQTYNAKELTIVGTVPGARKVEQQLHNKFKHLHVRGEWFHLTDEITQLFDGIA